MVTHGLIRQKWNLVIENRNSSLVGDYFITLRPLKINDYLIKGSTFINVFSLNQHSVYDHQNKR